MALSKSSIKSLPLFTYINGEYIPLSNNLKPIIKTKINPAFDKYIDLCSKHKSKKSCKSEVLYFKILSELFHNKKIEFVSDITREHIDFIEALFLQSMKPSSVNRRFKTINNFFNKCIDWNITFENPCERRIRLKESLNPRKVWSRKMKDAFLNECDDYHKKVFTFMWMTGCRQSELLNLKWTDVDYGDEDRKPTMMFTCGKNANISRPFPLVPKIDELLHGMSLDSIFVFSKIDRQTNTDNLYQYAKNILKRLKFDAFTPYGLRHGFASRLASGGANSFYISYLLGHQNYSTTRNYVHFDENVLHDLVSSVI